MLKLRDVSTALLMGALAAGAAYAADDSAFPRGPGANVGVGVGVSSGSDNQGPSVDAQGSVKADAGQSSDQANGKHNHGKKPAAEAQKPETSSQ